MSNQLIFKFPSIKSYYKEDFYVSDSNKEAFELIDKWPKWIKNLVNIYGPSGSGKSHLAAIFTTKTSFAIIKPEDLEDDVFYKVKPKEAIILEDLDQAVSEKILYSLLNTLEQDNKFLIITSKKPLSENL